ncbi:ankyrin repeat domain-containing protein [Candidatus Babeliales bacterium]|nr:ankyrin repeat domain-containing protein [Candidatus Babeliales bacterium]
MKKFILMFLFGLTLTANAMPAASSSSSSSSSSNEAPAASSSSSSSTNNEQQAPAPISSRERFLGQASWLGRCVLSAVAGILGVTVRIPYDFDILYATEEGDAQELRSLIAQGFDVNYVDRSCASRETALTLAIYCGNIETISLLLAAGANRQHKTANGETALERAKRLNKSQDIIDLLESPTTKRQRTTNSPQSPDPSLMSNLFDFPDNDELIDDDIYGPDVPASLPNTSSSSTLHTPAEQTPYILEINYGNLGNLEINYGDIDNKNVRNWIDNPTQPWSVSSEELD